MSRTFDLMGASQDAAAKDRQPDSISKDQEALSSSIRRSVTAPEMVIEAGRLVRVVSCDVDTTIAYIVAIAEPSKAIAIIREKIAAPEDQIADLGRVSGTLVRSLKLLPGDFVVATSSMPAKE